MAQVVVHVDRWDKKRDDYFPTEITREPFDRQGKALLRDYEWLTWAARKTRDLATLPAGTDGYCLSVWDARGETLADVRFSIDGKGEWHMDRTEAGT